MTTMTEETTTRVMVVDDHAVTRHGVVLLCNAADGIEVVGEASDGQEAIERIGRIMPDVVLMDVDMPRRDGISATREIRQLHPSIGVVVLTVHEDQETIFEAIKAGASGYLPKSATLDEIQRAVKAVAAGGLFLDLIQARKLLHQFNRYADETKGQRPTSTTCSPGASARSSPCSPRVSPRGRSPASSSSPSAR